MTVLEAYQLVLHLKETKNDLQRILDSVDVTPHVYPASLRNDINFLESVIEKLEQSEVKI